MGIAALAWPQTVLRVWTALAVIAWAACVVAPVPVLAAEPVYAIDLQVPEAQRRLLEDNLDLFRWRDNERMDEAQMRRLVRLAPEQVENLLASAGYFSPQVESSLEWRGDGWTVHLQVQPGDPARVRRIALQVTGAFDDGSSANRERLEQMRAQWRLPAGAVFRSADWEGAKRTALRALLLDRYPSARIADSQAAVDPDARTADLSLTLNSGPAFTFGALEIDGLKRYPASLIERLNPIKPGEPYSQAKLLELQSRLQDSPYFAGADVSVATDPLHPDAVPVRVAVREKPSQTLGLGIGMSTDSGPRGQIDYQDINLLGRAWRLSGNLKVNVKEQSLDGKLQFPLSAQGYQDALSAGLKRTDINGEVTRTLNLGATRSRTAGKNQTSWGLNYLHELQDVAGAPSGRSAALVLTRSWARRDVDNLLFPTRGYMASLETNGAAQALLSDRTFVRGDGKAAWFRPVGRRGQLIVRGELGIVAAKSRDGIPTDLLFRTGGDQTVRGYAYQSLGVRDGDAIVGGRWLAVASTEYVHWLTPSWGAAAFVDAGDAADRFGDLKVNVGYGVGARWKSPVGPLKLDIAYGEAARSLRLHFSIGFSF